MKIVIEDKNGNVIESFYAMDSDEYSRGDNTYIYTNESGYKELHIIKENK